ncbi:MAG: hypothetical protein EAZ90_26540 [Oscillatoriales cyanobacterium]|nr:MAG: hypothetical protein EAZ90_26540 [Oscillatoriales cyanobacterium]TAF92647.1 MAG: hypothetical protein EAZ49_00720 [Oscillatoriales cyanobacterium]TAG13947.1 MAG: hypothetical protein EAZ39_26310 [Oscillatoriales cyanobacterium]TAG41949.1 MAG: hypothetical protein EAZ33_16030 [Oscillatoriales cyanobacterium]TAG55629.1 MAG: hypothetical protein EAZ28_22015 [Oscillatoriales cyanobacterium]
MKNNNDDIFTAFIGAVLQQTEPLPAPVQLEFNKIDEAFTIIDIERLAELHPPLLAAYEETHNWLMYHSNERSKGLDVLPDSESEKENTTNPEISNAASDISDLTNLPKIINEIDTKVKPRGLKKILGKILQAGDSVQASRDTILSSIADSFTHD